MKAEPTPSAGCSTDLLVGGGEPRDVPQGPPPWIEREELSGPVVVAGAERIEIHMDCPGPGVSVREGSTGN